MDIVRASHLLDGAHATLRTNLDNENFIIILFYKINATK